MCINNVDYYLINQIKMMKLNFISSVITIFFFGFNHALQPLVPSEEYSNRIDNVCSGLDTESVLFWKLINGNEIQFEIHV